MADEIYAPWTWQQVRAINSYQTRADFPLICSRTRDRHQGRYVVLIARADGMHCSDPSCDYSQPWALDYMMEAGP